MGQLDQIALSYGGSFPVQALIDHIRRGDNDYLVVGQDKCAKAAHKKQHSLDYWLRQYAINEDTKQADNRVLTLLFATGKFEDRGRQPDPLTGRRCKAIGLTAKA